MKKYPVFYDLIINVEIYAGTHISDAIKETISLAKKRKLPVSFMFNGIQIKVEPISNCKDIERFYAMGIKRLAKKERMTCAIEDAGSRLQKKKKNTAR